MADFEYQSWKDRCDRYFSSISDTGKDRDQEKNGKNDSENSREKRATKNEFFDSNEKEWQDLSEMKRAYSENSFVRNIRNILSMMDFHGSKIASKSKEKVGFIIWMILILVFLTALSIALYFMLTDYIDDTSTFRITKIANSARSVPSNISLTVCNLNVIKKSRLADTGLKDLNSFISGETKLREGTVRSSVREVVENSDKLKEFITAHNPGKMSELIEVIENDVIAQELTRSSDHSILYRLSKYGRPQILREVIHITKTDLEKGGHGTNETLITCWKDNTKCQSKDIHTRSDPNDGNCILISGLGNSTAVELVLNARTEEYIYQITPLTGFKVTLGDGSGVLSSSIVEISPGYHSTISIDKLTSVRRLEGRCSVSGVSKTTCELNCLEEHAYKLCDCSVNGRTSTSKLCMLNRMSDYICVKSLKWLQIQGNLPCHCREKCSETKIDLKMSTNRWPYKQYTDSLGTSLSGHQAQNESYLRENIAFLTIHLLPSITEEIEEHKAYGILDMLARIGGLSALIAGVSFVTILEILYIAVHSLVRSFLYIRKRSGSVASQRRLSDSEITSITWAMYRQRRRFEEVNKMKADKLANSGVNGAMGGNVHARISKRSSFDREPSNDHVTPNNHKQYRSSDYSRRYDGKNPFYQQRSREKYVKDSDLNKENNNEEYAVNVIRPQRQNDYIYGNHRDPIHNGHALHKNGTNYKDTNAADKHPQNVFLYDGAVAYFNPTNVSEPVYL